MQILHTMIYSMTGYGKVTTTFSAKKITIELKSLNSKNLDLNIRIPYQYKEKELFLRKELSKHLVRGKVDFSIYIEDNGVEGAAKINTSLLSDYMNQLREITEGSEIELLKIASKFPDVLKSEKQEIDDEEWSEIYNTILAAIDALKHFRKDEGNVLYVDFETRISHIHQYLAKVKQINPERIEKVKERLQKSIQDLSIEVDQNRFEQELIYYIEKFDITEEIVRLENHLNYFMEELNSEVSNGKKMGFITQEMGREINTIGSKSNYAPMQKVVVQMKDELEKIKEQMLNVL